MDPIDRGCFLVGSTGKRHTTQVQDKRTSDTREYSHFVFYTDR